MHAPGLNASELERMTKPQTDYLRQRVEGEVKDAQEAQFAMFKILCKGIGALGRRL
jgi:hypothetical protein